MKLILSTSLSLGLVLLALAPAASAGPAQDQMIASYATAAKTADPAFAGFSADAGKAFFLADHTGGKPDTPSCTSCHTKDVTKPGRTRAGKSIDAMALSATPDRFSDPAKVEKWFTRNCNSVLGRECTPVEKGDILTWLASQ